jgi:hypothetical protein
MGGPSAPREIEKGIPCNLEGERVERERDLII